MSDYDIIVIRRRLAAQALCQRARRGFCDPGGNLALPATELRRGETLNDSESFAKSMFVDQMHLAERELSGAQKLFGRFGGAGIKNHRRMYGNGGSCGGNDEGGAGF